MRKGANEQPLQIILRATMAARGKEEAAHALWRNAKSGRLANDEAAERLSELRTAPVAALAMERHPGHALDLAAAIGHPAYDCIYPALTLHHRRYAVTADRRFASAANLPHLSSSVRLLSA
jgi:predicted nucleic acid-binding protein